MSRAGSATAASPPYSEITTLLAMSSAVSSKGARTTLAPRVRSRPTLPENPPPALHSVFFGGVTKVEECDVIPPSARNCQDVPTGCQRPKRLKASARESIAAKFAWRSVNRAPTNPSHQALLAYSADRIVERLLSLSLMPVPLRLTLGRRSASTQRIRARASP